MFCTSVSTSFALFHVLLSFALFYFTLLFSVVTLLYFALYIVLIFFAFLHRVPTFFFCALLSSFRVLHWFSLVLLLLSLSRHLQCFIYVVLYTALSRVTLHFSVFLNILCTVYRSALLCFVFLRSSSRSPSYTLVFLPSRSRGMLRRASVPRLRLLRFVPLCAILLPLVPLCSVSRENPRLWRNPSRIDGAM